jgi:hypothetical protein
MAGRQGQGAEAEKLVYRADDEHGNFNDWNDE